MSSINRVSLLGNVGSVEIKEFGNERKLVQVSIATSESYKKGEEWIEKTEWHKCIFGIPNLAERATKIQKGDKIYAEGAIQTNSWTDKEGKERSNKEINCTMFKTHLKNKNNAEMSDAEFDAKKSNSDEAMPF